MRLALRVLGTEVVALEYRPTRPATPPPDADGDLVVQDCSDTSGDGERIEDPAVPFGFAAEVLAMPSTVLQPPDDEEDDDACRTASPRIGFSAGF